MNAPKPESQQRKARTSATSPRSESASFPSGAGNGPADAPASTHPRCRNCGAPLTGAWCAQCGQQLRDLDRPFLALLGEFLENAFSFDGRLARTFGLLLFRPGALTCRYLAGQRVRFVPPVRLFVIVLVLFFLALEISGVALVQFRSRPADASGAGIVSVGADGESRSLDLVLLAPSGPREKAGPPLVPERGPGGIARETQPADGAKPAGRAFARRLMRGFERALRDPTPLNAFLRDWLPRVLFLLIPVFALLLRGLFSARRYFDHLVFALHIHTFFFLAASLMIPWAVAGWSQWAGRVLLLAGAAYTLVATKRFAGRGWPGTVVRLSLLLTFYVTIVMMALAVLLLIGVERL